MALSRWWRKDSAPCIPLWALLSHNKLWLGCIRVCLCSYIQSIQSISLLSTLSLKWVQLCLPRPAAAATPTAAAAAAAAVAARMASKQLLTVSTQQASGRQGL